MPTENAIEPVDPNYRARVRGVFDAAPFVNELGISFTDCGPGWCEAELLVEARHEQQNGFVHAGVQSTLADHVAGAAAGTLLSPEQIVLSVEYKIQLLRPAQGERLSCRAEVIRPGRRIVAVQASVRCDGRDTAVMMGTMALVQKEV